MENKVIIKNLNKYFGKLHILHDINLKVKSGEVVCLICLLYTSPSPRDA